MSIRASQIRFAADDCLEEDANGNLQIKVVATGGIQRDAVDGLELSIPHVTGKTAPPGATDDSNSTPPFVAGSTWTDTTNQRLYACVDPTPGAAVWFEVVRGSRPITVSGTALSPDMANSFEQRHFVLNASGNSTVNAPINMQIGSVGHISIRNTTAADIGVTFNAAYNWPEDFIDGGTHTLTLPAGAIWYSPFTLVNSEYRFSARFDRRNSLTFSTNPQTTYTNRRWVRSDMNNEVFYFDPASGYALGELREVIFNNRGNSTASTNQELRIGETRPNNNRGYRVPLNSSGTATQLWIERIEWSYTSAVATAALQIRERNAGANNILATIDISGSNLGAVDVKTPTAVGASFIKIRIPATTTNVINNLIVKLWVRRIAV